MQLIIPSSHTPITFPNLLNAAGLPKYKIPFSRSIKNILSAQFKTSVESHS